MFYIPTPTRRQKLPASSGLSAVGNSVTAVLSVPSMEHFNGEGLYCDDAVNAHSLGALVVLPAVDLRD
jgi:hypothetical protein